MLDHRYREKEALTAPDPLSHKTYLHRQASALGCILPW
jgi:hypothetical protein